MMDLIEEYILLAGIVIFGATAHALAQLSTARRSNETFDLIDFVIALVISAFSGTIFGILAALWWENSLAIHALAGMGAFLGLKGLNAISEALINALVNKARKS